MKDIIGAVSAAVGFAVLAFCMWQGVDMGVSVLRAVMSATVCSVLAYAGVYVFKIQLTNEKTPTDEQETSEKTDAKAKAAAKA
ncbi:hypothetical protein A2V82_15260 [candidate division KSB1 bacterium RBG_16_48_16]|nr:MAG: hypothetical protein A2V82_15260 [candidate division KSB1 bacterium RBG_16_48_16]